MYQEMREEEEAKEQKKNPPPEPKKKSKITDMDGTVSVFKIVKEAVDDIRRQVEKCEENIRMKFFLSKEQFEPEGSIPGLDFDPFYHPKESHRGL